MGHDQAPPQAAPSLDKRKLYDVEFPGGVWEVTLYPDAGEAVGCRVRDVDREPVDLEALTDEQRAAREADHWERANRQARSTSRRYIVSNRLRYMWVLTYAEGLHGPDGREQVMCDVAKFMRRLRAGGFRSAWWASPELHPDGHGWHVNVLVPVQLPHELMARLWGHGHVWVSDWASRKRFRGQDVSFMGRLRRGAQYACKYAVKDWSTQNLGRDVQRYTCARGHAPRVVRYRLDSCGASMRAVAAGYGRAPDEVWKSADEPCWFGPECFTVAWDGPPG